MQALRRIARNSPAFNAAATMVLRNATISAARTPPRPRNWGHSMRKAITLLELSIGASVAIAVAAYMAHGFVLAAAMVA